MQFSKALDPISITEDGMFIDSKLLQSLNEYSEILVTEDGIKTSFNFMQFLKILINIINILNKH